MTVDRAERSAGAIRELIVTGRLVPGQRLSEQTVSESLDVSRNTLREAFRILVHEGLLVRRPNAGVAVARPTLADIVDIYRVRRLIEVPVLAAGDPAHPGARMMRDAVDAALAARLGGDWRDIAAANMRFHSGIVALAGSPRLERVHANLSAELRLSFGLLGDDGDFFDGFVDRNAGLLRRFLAGDADGAAADLNRYLTDSERMLQQMVDRAGTAGTPDTVSP
ncbi:GntR family transcriptional regulator [Promicromonospora thailandica]|uniref:DNA-binding transcriptional regulator, GntR family n=1 Tax=Promicromonospora thailandica TaxID=765201 RepID=A0A9X2JWC5_9MICO|nr:GntR family transcriptional regulator [Promicromonospora thailandica]MCP2266475.1 DNA-binding transcriptional regulator, GntR family [Promicromonospora thailandica]BFF20163.1 GntR family transcriptional regulator [Promicromonospora thailandica]